MFSHDKSKEKTVHDERLLVLFQEFPHDGSAIAASNPVSTGRDHFKEVSFRADTAAGFDPDIGSNRASHELHVPDCRTTRPEAGRGFNEVRTRSFRG